MQRRTDTATGWSRSTVQGHHLDAVQDYLHPERAIILPMRLVEQEFNPFLVVEPTASNLPPTVGRH